MDYAEFMKRRGMIDRSEEPPRRGRPPKGSMPEKPEGEPDKPKEPAIQQPNEPGPE
jgi:hypothetical protein